MTDYEKAQLLRWAKKNLKFVGHVFYPTYEATMFSSKQHRLFRFRLCFHDAGADYVLMTCPGGYGALEEQWHGINMGLVKGIKDLRLLYKWFMER